MPRTYQPRQLRRDYRLGVARRMATQTLVRGVLLLVVAAILLRPPPLLAQGIDSRLGFGHTAGELVGLDDGYTRFDSFLPLVQLTSDSLVFADLRFLLFNEQTEADGVNLGFGTRVYDSLADRVFGANFYYDYRDTGASHYNQLSWGVESLGRRWDYRLNAHLPVGDTWNDYVDAATPTAFNGSHLWFTNIQQEVALRGLQGEVAVVLIDRGLWQLRTAGGVYGYWHSGAGVEAVGPRLRLELRVADQLWLGGSVQHDDEFDTTAGVTLSWRYGLTRHFERCRSSDNVACRLGDPVERNEQVAIKRFIGGPSTARVVRAPDGHAYTFHHVNSSAAAGGDGTFESPSPTLFAASNQPEDIVLVHGGSEFTGEAFTTNTPGQRVLAEGVEHVLITRQAGPITLPTAGSSAAPIIRDSPGDAITIQADGVEVSGFEIVDPSWSFAYQHSYGYFTDDLATDVYLPYVEPAGRGIVAEAVGNVDINRNRVTGAADSGIELHNLGGTNRLYQNQVYASGSRGMEIVGNYSGVLESNVADRNQQTGIEILGDVDGTLLNNSTSQNGWGGMVVYGNVSGNVEGNIAAENHGSGVRIDGSVAGSIVGNQVLETLDYQVPVLHAFGYNLEHQQQLSGAAPSFQAVIEVDRFFLATPASPGNGIEVGGSIGGDVVDNVVQANAGDGIRIEGNLAGRLSNNLASDNLETGVRIEGLVYGDAMNNRTDSNGGDGMYAKTFMGSVLDNHASHNGNFGILTEEVVGMQMRNEGVGNGAGSSAMNSPPALTLPPVFYD